MPLPPGTALNPLTGQISGVPTTPGTYNFTLRVRDAQGSLRDIPQSITIANYTPPSLSGSIDGFANRTVPYSSGFVLAGGTAPFTWSIASGTLPTGMAINSSTGVISGTPTDTTYTDRNITVRVVDAQGSPAQRTQTIRYADVLALSGSLAAGVQGSAYSSGFTRTGGHSPFTYSLIAGTLPSGLSLNSSTGIIAGTPTVITSAAITIRVVDAAGDSDDRSQTLVINSSYVPIDISGSVSGNSQSVETLSSFSITPNYSGVTVAGGSGPITYSWARISGSAAISAGSPSSLGTSFVGSVAPGGSESATFRVTATDGTSSDTLDVTITVTNIYTALSLSAAGLALGTRLVAYSSSLSRSGGRSPFTFSVIAGALPTGITLNSSTGALSGTPTDTGYTTRSLTFRVVDSLGASADASGSLVYRNAPGFSYTLPAAMRTRAYSTSPSLTPGGHGFGSMAITSGSLPSGISLTPSSGTIAGTPTDTSYGTRSINFQFTDAASNVAAQTGVSLPYADNLTVAGTFPAGTVGSAYSSSALSASGGFGSNAWSVASGSLPAGLSLNSSTGALSGTPTTSGTSSFTIRVTDAQGFTADSPQSVTISVAALVVDITPASDSGSFTDIDGPSTAFVTSAGVTASASGGVAPRTFNGWTRISGSSAISANSPSSATTNFSGTVGVGTTSATFRAQFTDSLGNVATDDVVVDLTYENGV